MEKLLRCLLYSMFMIYLSYIYSILILCYSMGEDIKRLYFGGTAFCCMVLSICFEVVVGDLAAEAVFAEAVVVVELDEGL